MFTNWPAAARSVLPQSMSMLALLLLLHHATATDKSQETHIIEKIVSCPDVGYYFERDVSWNATEPICRLCFCRDNGTAVCWRRELSGCDVRHYHHFGDQNRARVRRSAGLAEVFFRDAAKDVFNKNTPEQCKPFESSYSEGCPPVDWCLGCTVCDCDAYGRWNCHTLSFCTDDHGKNKMQKKRNRIGRPQVLKKTPKTTKKPYKYNPPKTFSKPPAARRQRRLDNEPAKPQSKPTKEKNKLKNIISVKKAKAPVYKNKPTKKSLQKPSTKIIQESKKPSSAQNITGKSKTIKENEEALRNIMHTIYKKVMAAVQKIMIESHKNITDQKITSKRSMKKYYKNYKDKKINTAKSTKIQNIKRAPKDIQKNQTHFSKKGYKRSKREIPTNISTYYYLKEANVSTATNTDTAQKSLVYQTLDFMLANTNAVISPKPDYFKYSVDMEQAKVIGNKNFTSTRKERFSIPRTTKNATNETIYNPLYPLNISSIRYHYVEGKTIYKSKKKLMNISNSLNINNTCGKICKFKKFFKKFVGFHNTNTTMHTINEMKNSNITKYFKRNIKNTVKTIKKPIWKRVLVRKICKNFGFCKIDPGNNTTLSSNIYSRLEERNKAIKSIDEIKRILQLIQIYCENIKHNSITVNKHLLKNDIEKFTAILKEKHQEYNLSDSTETLQQNCKVFMQSLENLAQVLNDIVQVKPHHKIYHPKVLNSYLKKHNPHKTIKVNKLKLYKSNKNGEKLDKIKELFINYNLVQNEFMKRMYDLIMSLGPKPIKIKDKEIYKDMKVRNEININNESVATEIYMKNIIDNLRKLKKLTQKFSIKHRTKRDVTEDDNFLEYLLILMEYLLKQKHLRTYPASDDIDLWIDVIKSAPDIKATRKKELDHNPAKLETDTTVSISTLPKTTKIIDMNTNTFNYVIPKFKTFESIDDDEESSDFYQYNKKIDKSNYLKTKEKLESEDIIYPSTTQDAYISVPNDDKNNIVLTKIDTKNKDNVKGYEIYPDDTDENDGVLLTTTKPPEVTRASDISNIPTTITPIIRNEQSTSKLSHNGNTNKVTRLKLDWIEDSYNQENERKQLPRFKENTTPKLSPTHTTLVVATRTKPNKMVKSNKYDDPISSISKETTEEESKKYMLLNSEYVMHKKQMNLLNSLDYGTEKIEVDADSKEDKPNVEQFSLYTV